MLSEIMDMIINARTTKLLNSAAAGSGSFLLHGIRNRFENAVLTLHFCMPHERWDAEGKQVRTYGQDLIYNYSS